MFEVLSLLTTLKVGAQPGWRVGLQGLLTTHRNRVVACVKNLCLVFGVN
jgi:hypothetical protein